MTLPLRRNFGPGTSMRSSHLCGSVCLSFCVGERREKQSGNIWTSAQHFECCSSFRGSLTRAVISMNYWQTHWRSRDSNSNSHSHEQAAAAARGNFFLPRSFNCYRHRADTLVVVVAIVKPINSYTASSRPWESSSTILALEERHKERCWNYPEFHFIATNYIDSPHFCDAD